MFNFKPPTNPITQALTNIRSRISGPGGGGNGTQANLGSMMGGTGQPAPAATPAAAPHPFIANAMGGTVQPPPQQPQSSGSFWGGGNAIRKQRGMAPVQNNTAGKAPLPFNPGGAMGAYK